MPAAGHTETRVGTAEVPVVQQAGGEGSAGEGGTAGGALRAVPVAGQRCHVQSHRALHPRAQPCPSFLRCLAPQTTTATTGAAPGTAVRGEGATCDAQYYTKVSFTGRCSTGRWLQ